MAAKELKQYFVATGDIKEDLESDDVQPTFDGINYTADMFGDIETKSSPVKESRESSRQHSSKTSHVKTDIQLVNGDEYARSFAVGFDIVVSSPENVSPFIIEKEKVDDNACAEANVNKSEHNEQGEEKMFLLIDEIHDSNCEKRCSKNSEIDTKEVNLPIDVVSVVNSTTADDTIKQVSVDQSKKTPKTPKTKKRTVVQPKNKVGQRSETKKDKSRDKSPFQKSPIANMRHNTNRVNPQNSPNKPNVVVQKENCDETSVKAKFEFLPTENTNKDSKKDKLNDEIEMETKVDTEFSNAITVAEAKISDIADNTSELTPLVPEQNQITCFAEVHREKTLSPSPSRDENGTRNSIQSSDSSNQRQRKISVISIGSVLQHGKETLV